MLRAPKCLHYIMARHVFTNLVVVAMNLLLCNVMAQALRTANIYFSSTSLPQPFWCVWGEQVVKHRLNSTACVYYTFLQCSSHSLM